MVNVMWMADLWHSTANVGMDTNNPPNSVRLSKTLKFSASPNVASSAPPTCPLDSPASAAGDPESRMNPLVPLMRLWNVGFPPWTQR